MGAAPLFCLVPCGLHNAGDDCAGDSGCGGFRRRSAVSCDAGSGFCAAALSGITSADRCRERLDEGHAAGSLGRGCGSGSPGGGSCGFGGSRCGNRSGSSVLCGRCHALCGRRSPCDGRCGSGLGIRRGRTLSGLYGAERILCDGILFEYRDQQTPVPQDLEEQVTLAESYLNGRTLTEEERAFYGIT